MKFKYLFLLTTIAWPSIAFAQEVEAPEEEASEEAHEVHYVPPVRENLITVLANGSRQRIETTAQSITVFDRREIDAVQGADLTRLLERAPGVSLSRNGGLGTFTGVRVRGAEGEQLLVLIDGVRMADTAAPGGGFDFGNLLMGNLAKVELQRSSNSTIWGSQALGGVLAATTGREEGVSGSVEYGAHDTLYGTAGASFDVGPASFGVHAGHFDSDGFSAAAAGSEPDGFRQTELGGRAEIDLDWGLSAFATGRYADGRLEIDGFPPPTFMTLADTAEYQDTRQRSGAAGLRYRGDYLDIAATFSLADTERDSFDAPSATAPFFFTDGESERAELRGRWRFLPDHWLALDFGAEREWLRFQTPFDPLARTATTGGYLQLDYDRQNLHLAAGVRRDEHRDFGGEWSFGADGAYDFGRARVFASYGEGFKAPTLFQLHSDFGNDLLQPERSRSYDAGAALDYGPGELKLTAFRRDTENLIVFVNLSVPPFGRYENIGRARAQGLEAEANARFGSIALAAAYTLLDAEDRTPGSAIQGNDLARRPRHALTLSGDWSATADIRFGADLRVVSGSFDDARNFVALGGYEVLTLRAEWDAIEHVTLFGRVENVWDENYQTAAGYGTPGRGAYVGARARF